MPVAAARRISEFTVCEKVNAENGAVRRRELRHHPGHEVLYAPERHFNRRKPKDWIFAEGGHDVTHNLLVPFLE